MPTKTYTGQDVDVTFDPAVCIHCGDCTKGLGAVFDIHRRPWVLPDNADADAVIAQVKACPSGALQYVPKAGQPEESPDEHPTARAVRDGPLYVRGDLAVQTATGETVQGTRLAFCRCGGSKRMPFCDNTHRRIGFKDPAPPSADAEAPRPPG